MAVLSPALVVAMCVMFVLTRLQRHYYIFEHLFLFGLRYCLEPKKSDLENIAKLTAANKAPQASQPTSKKSKSRTVPQPTPSASKTRITAASLTVRRTKLNATFFSHSAEFPHHRHFGHLMTLCCGYFAAYLFEECVRFFYPNFLANKRSVYVAIFGIGFALLESLRISLDMTSIRSMSMLGGIGLIISMLLVSAADFPNFIRFEQAFIALRHSTTFILANRLNMDDTKADAIAVKVALLGRFLVVSVAALISAATGAPARHFSRLDYLLHSEYREDEKDRQDDPYYLGKPTPMTMLKVAADYALPLLAVVMWVISPRGDGAYQSWRLGLMMATVGWRLIMTRLRLQMYLDSALEGYRTFWLDKAATGVLKAGHRTTVQVISKSFHLLTITMAYLSPTVIPMLFVVIAKLDGGIPLGLWVSTSEQPEHIEVFAREIAGFLAWWSLACYLSFGTMSIIYEIVADMVDPGGRDRRRAKMPPPSTSSERRKFKRMMREEAA